MLRIFATTSFQFSAKRHKSSLRLLTTTQLDGGAPRKSARGRQSDRRQVEESGMATTLEWETFDFSDSPKWDKRFDDKLSLASNTENWEEIEERAAAEKAAEERAAAQAAAAETAAEENAAAEKAAAEKAAAEKAAAEKAAAEKAAAEKAAAEKAAAEKAAAEN